MWRVAMMMMWSLSRQDPSLEIIDHITHLWTRQQNNGQRDNVVSGDDDDVVAQPSL